MQITVLSTDISQPFEGLRQYLPLICEKRRQRISQLQKNEDKLTSFFTELLMTSAIAERLKIKRSEVRYSRNEHGKPYLPDISEYHFSVSHSEGLIAFADSSRPIGIDVQRIADAPRRAAERFFTDGERRYIADSRQPSLAFFEVWTAKEAYVKLLGEGLSKPFRSFDVKNDALGCSFMSKIIDDYMLTVCTEAPISTLEVAQITGQELLDSIKAP